MGRETGNGTYQKTVRQLGRSGEQRQPGCHKCSSSPFRHLTSSPPPCLPQVAHTCTFLHQNLLGFLLKCRFQGPTPDKGNSLVWVGSRICNFRSFPRQLKKHCHLSTISPKLVHPSVSTVATLVPVQTYY